MVPIAAQKEMQRTNRAACTGCAGALKVRWYEVIPFKFGIWRLTGGFASPADFLEALIRWRLYFLPDPVEIHHLAELAVREGVLL